MAWEREVEVARAAAQAGAQVVAAHSSAERRSSWEKSYDNPVTAADLEANAAIVRVLRAAFPDDAILSEETADSSARLGASRIWIVDPLDGTKEFVAGVPEFATSVALAVDGQPVAGCLHQPLSDESFWALRGGGAYLGEGERIAVSSARELAKSVMLSSRTEMSRGQLEKYRDWFARIDPIGSVAWKLALVASARADLWLSVAPKSEWDVCAGDLLVHEAGGAFVELCRGARRYNQANVLLEPLLAAGPLPLVLELGERACE